MTYAKRGILLVVGLVLGWIFHAMVVYWFSHRVNEFLITFVGRTDVAYIAYALGVEMLGQALLWAGLAVAFAVSRRFFIAGFFYGMLDMHTKGTPMHLYFYRFYVTDSMNSGWHVFGYMLVIAAVVTPIVFYVIELTERKTA